MVRARLEKLLLYLCGSRAIEILPFTASVLPAEIENPAPSAVALALENRTFILSAFALIEFVTLFPIPERLKNRLNLLVADFASRDRQEPLTSLRHQFRETFFKNV